MRGKRSKQYRKLMEQYSLTYGFRKPYQVLVDADIIRAADRFKMDLQGGLARTLQDETKLMITQCSMRHLYAAAKEPGVSYLIDKAKTFERRRCGHRPEDYPEPLSTKECLSSVVDPKNKGTNHHNYVVASQDIEVRKTLRGILGVPLVYINDRSVMVMEPMSDASASNRQREERRKFTADLRGGKRKRDEDEEDDGGPGPKQVVDDDEPKKKKKKKIYDINGRVKGPNPRSQMKSKKKPLENTPLKNVSQAATQSHPVSSAEPPVKKKKKRTHSKKPEENDGTTGVGAIGVAVGAES